MMEMKWFAIMMGAIFLALFGGLSYSEAAKEAAKPAAIAACLAVDNMEYYRGDCRRIRN